MLTHVILAVHAKQKRNGRGIALAKQRTIASLAWEMFVDQQSIRDYIAREGLKIESVTINKQNGKRYEVISGETVQYIKENFQKKSLKLKERVKEVINERKELFNNPIIGQNFETGETWGSGIARFWAKERAEYIRGDGLCV